VIRARSKNKPETTIKLQIQSDVNSERHENGEIGRGGDWERKEYGNQGTDTSKNN
jgi:hypothetical protein